MKYVCMNIDKALITQPNFMGKRLHNPQSLFRLDIIVFPVHSSIIILDLFYLPKVAVCALFFPPQRE